MMLAKSVVPLYAGLLLLPNAAVAQDTVFIGQDKNNITNLSTRAADLYSAIGNQTGTGALRAQPLWNDEKGFLCAMVVVKGNEPFHTHDQADLFASVFHGGGYLNVGGGKSVELQVGTNVLIEKGQSHQLFNKANDYTAAIACFYPNDNSGSKPVDENPGPDIAFTPMPESTFKTVNGTVTNLLDFFPPTQGESRAVYPNARTDLVSVATVVLATSEVYHVHQESALFVIVVKGNVETSSATDEDTMISVPEGSFMVLEKCTPHKFVNLDGPDHPAILLAAFGPVLMTGDSPITDDAECLSNNTDTSGATAKTAGIILWVPLLLFVVVVIGWIAI